jgi:hypothetical protein
MLLVLDCGLINKWQNSILIAESINIRDSNVKAIDVFDFFFNTLLLNR